LDSIHSLASIIIYLHDGGKASEKVSKEKVTAIGFADTGTSAVFYLDNLNFE